LKRWKILRGSELSAYNDFGGIIRKEVWSVKILPSENKIEIHTRQDDEPETKNLENFLEAHDTKIEIVNWDYLDHICEEDYEDKEVDVDES
jgi:hypothetical protein